MSSSVVFYAIGDFLASFLGVIYDNVGNVFNYSCIVLGFIGLFYWLNFQKKANAKAANDPNQIK